MLDLFDYMGHSKYDDEELNLGTRVIDIDTIDCNSAGRVPKGYDMRLDLIANDINNNTATMDFVMYVNHIFNPFAITEGDVLIIPIYNESLYLDPEEIVYPSKSIKVDYNDETQEEINQAANILKNNPDSGRKTRLARLAETLTNGVSNISGPNEL